MANTPTTPTPAPLVNPELMKLTNEPFRLLPYMVDVESVEALHGKIKKKSRLTRVDLYRMAIHAGLPVITEQLAEFGEVKEGA